MPTAISLFTGIGGLDFGFEAAGFTTAVAVEIDDIACRTVRLNRSWPLLQGDIHAIPSAAILRSAQLRRGEADVLIGGPPCQPFSKSSYWARGDTGRLDDPRADTLTAFLRVLRDTKPRAFLLENVPGFAFKGKDEGLRYVIDAVEEVNRQAKTKYRVFSKLVNTANYGVPQVRERVFVVASREGREFRFPPLTHFDASKHALPNSKAAAFRTAWDALGDLPEHVEDESLRVSGRWAQLLPSIPEGENYLWHTSRGGGLPLFGWRTRYWSFLLKLRKDRPAWTIQASPGPAIGPFHWKNRKLSDVELCRLQTFPERLHFNCRQADVQKLVGNAVPSLVSEVLARAIREQLLDDRPRTRRLKLLPPVRTPTPMPEPTLPVPETYWHRIGEHKEHPGEGLGAGAVKRVRLNEIIQSSESVVEVS